MSAGPAAARLRVDEGGHGAAAGPRPDPGPLHAAERPPLQQQVVVEAAAHHRRRQSAVGNPLRVEPLRPVLLLAATASGTGLSLEGHCEITP